MQTLKTVFVCLLWLFLFAFPFLLFASVVAGAVFAVLTCGSCFGWALLSVFVCGVIVAEFYVWAME